MIQLRIFETTTELYRAAADQVEKLCQRKPGASLGLAAGATPTPLYALLGERCRMGLLNLSGITAFNLDEYVGVPTDHYSSFFYYCQKHLIEPCGIRDFFGLNGAARDPQTEAREYACKIGSLGAVDLQILGIGTNGHIGFNEPGSKAGNPARVVDLSAETVGKLKPESFPGGRVPRQGITLGMKEVLASGRILLIATGRSKARSVRAAVQEPPSAECPASFLQLHSLVDFYLDKDAASELSRPF